MRAIQPHVVGKYATNKCERLKIAEDTIGAVKKDVETLESVMLTVTGGTINSINYINSLKNKNIRQDSAIDAVSNAVNSLNNTFTAYKTVQDTRDANQSPSWYWSNYSRQVFNEFKYKNSIGISGTNTYGLLTTYVQF